MISSLFGCFYGIMDLSLMLSDSTSSVRASSIRGLAELEHIPKHRLTDTSYKVQCYHAEFECSVSVLFTVQ